MYLLFLFLLFGYHQVMIRIYIDADSLPLRQRSILLKRLRKEGLESFFVADRPVRDILLQIEEHTAELRAPFRGVLEKEELKKIRSPLKFIQVPTGANSADDYLVSISEAPGLCVTHDIPLASRMIEKGILVIDDRGNRYDEKNIRERLSERDYMTEFRQMGIFSPENRKFDHKDVEKFSNALDHALLELQKR